MHIPYRLGHLRLVLCSLHLQESQLHGMVTTSVSTSKDRILNWNRQRKSRLAANQRSISSIAKLTLATAISTVQPLCSLKANQ